MGFFWFIVAVVLLIVLLRRNSSSPGTYQQGYWDGYRALGTKVQQQLNQPRLDAEELQTAVDVGRSGVEPINAPGTSSESSNEVAATHEVSMNSMPAADATASGGGMDVPAPPAATTVQPATAITQPVVISADDAAARSLRNLNTILYMASFLLVAAGALFVAAAMPDTVKLVGVWVIIIVFYGAGYVLHRMVARLQPASVAFLGTGLALIPFAGFALDQYTVMGAETAWLVTSVVGLVGYLVAAIRLQNQFISYLTMAFVLSLVGAGSASISLGLVWQFVLFIGVALIASTIALLKPQWMPSVFRRPIESTGQLVTPIVLIASLFVGHQIHVAGYEIIFTVATLYYVVVWLQMRSLLYESVIRTLTMLCLVIFAWDIGGLGNGLSATIVLLASAQLAYSLYVVRRPGRQAIEYRWLAIATVIQILTLLSWVGGDQLASLYLTIGLLAVGASNLAVVLRLRSAPVALVGLGVALVVPFVAGQNALQPSLPDSVLALWFILSATWALIAYAQLRRRSVAVRQVMTTSYIIFAAVALLIGVSTGSLLESSVTLLALAAFSLAISYVVRLPYVQIVSACFILAGAAAMASWLSIDATWTALLLGGSVAIVCWLVALVQARLRQSLRWLIMLGSGQAALLVTLGSFLVFTPDPTAQKLTIILLLSDALVSLTLRAHYHTGNAAISRLLAWSYATYAIAVLLFVAVLGSSWIAPVVAIVAALTVAASYIERRPYLQAIAAGLAVISLSALSTAIAVPLQLWALCSFGGAAALFYVAAYLHATFGQTPRYQVMIIAGQVALFMTAFGAATGDTLVTQLTFSIMLLAALWSLALRLKQRVTTSPLRTLWLLSYVMYFVAASVLAIWLSPVWGIAGLMIGSAIWWLASYVERRSWMMTLGNIFCVVALTRLWAWLSLDLTWMVLGVTWVATALFYGAYWVFVQTGDRGRQQVMLWSTWLLLGLAVVSQLWIDTVAVAASVTLVVLAATVGVSAYRAQRFGVIEAMVYVATFGLQRITGLLFPDINLVVYAHWWALTIAAVMLFRSAHRRRRLVVAVAFITVSTGMYALLQGGGYQLLFLVEHLVLLVAGALLSRSWATWWGISATALAVLYFLRGYTFLWLGFLGLLLIGIVVWRLLRGGTPEVSVR